MKAAHYPWLDVARGVSALLVVAGHCRAALFPPLSSIASPTLIEKFFYAITSLGYLAVMAFFVLSGFLVGGSGWLSEFAIPNPDKKDFEIRII